MTNRELDALMQEAFGDADQTVSNTLEAQRTKATFQQLKQDLLSLNEVPECQLSMERVQHAILKGAQTRQAVRPWPWLTGLGLASAAVYAAWFGLNTASTWVASVDGADGPLYQTEPLVVASQIENSASAKTLGNDVSDKLKSFARPSVQPSANVELPRANRVRTASARPLSSRSGDAGNQESFDVAPAAPGFSGSLTESADNPVPELPVVVVSGTADPETGASSAKEVVNSDHVVFGG